jgi:hypothetical protein
MSGELEFYTVENLNEMAKRKETGTEHFEAEQILLDTLDMLGYTRITAAYKNLRTAKNFTYSKEK